MAEDKKKKIDYREVAENTLTRGSGLLKNLYEKLSQMPEADIQARISEINEAMELVDRATARTQRIARLQEAKRKTNQILREESVKRSYCTRRCKRCRKSKNNDIT